jgi:hypothetical protein
MLFVYATDSQLAFPVPVHEINHQANAKPNEKPLPV